MLACTSVWRGTDGTASLTVGKHVRGVGHALALGSPVVASIRTGTRIPIRTSISMRVHTYKHVRVDNSLALGSPVLANPYI